MNEESLKFVNKVFDRAIDTIYISLLSSIQTFIYNTLNCTQS